MIERIHKEIENLTPALRRQINNVIVYHGINKKDAAISIAKILKQPLKVNSIYEILTYCK
jgi:hypothetical protein